VAFLELAGISKRYGDVQAVDELTLSVREGRLVTLLGPSGSGKSTLLRIVAGLETADGGTIHIDGADVSSVQASERGVSMVFQSFALFPHMSVAQNIGFGLRARKTPADEIKRRVEEVARSLGLQDVLGRRPSQLSGGERQRVALARGLVRRPRLLLMDEPLSNLDAQLRAQTRTEIRQLHAQAAITLLYVTHDQAEALSLGEAVVILDGGRLQQVGAPAHVYEHPANLFVARFLGSPPMNVVEACVNGATVEAPGIRVALNGRPPESGRRVMLGFRPENVSIAPSPPRDTGLDLGLHGVLELSEHVGHERLWHLRVGERLLAVRPAATDTASKGEGIRVIVEPAAVRLFDPDTGAAI
jgi:multiple sugar transport system ATP-binding protein